MKALVTGAAGFIGSHLVDRLLMEGYEVVGFDNLSTGVIRNLDAAWKHQPRFRLSVADLLLDNAAVMKAMAGIDVVFHLAGNADVRFGVDHPTKNLEQNTRATCNVLEAMRQCGVKEIVFTSTAAVYGDSNFLPTPENAPLALQTSLYGASKLAAEGFIQAYCESFGMRAWIFRLVPIIGERYSHGHIIDFYRQLSEHPGHLVVLGNGNQLKSYLYVGDCIEAVLLAYAKARGKVNIYNVGSDECWEVSRSVRYICDHMIVNPEITYTGGSGGWVGDAPVVRLDCSRLRGLGWAPKLKTGKVYHRTLDYLEQVDQAKPVVQAEKGGN